MKQTKISYDELLEEYGSDENFVLNMIDSLTDKTEQDRLIASVEEHYAKKYNCETQEVFYGSVKFRRGYWDNVLFPYTVIVGNLSARGCNISAPNLKAVIGELDLTGAFADIRALERVDQLIVNDATIRAYNPDMKVGNLTCNGKCRGYKKPKTTVKQKDKQL